MATVHVSDATNLVRPMIEARRTHALQRDAAITDQEIDDWFDADDALLDRILSVEPTTSEEAADLLEVIADEPDPAAYRRELSKIVGLLRRLGR